MRSFIEHQSQKLLENLVCVGKTFLCVAILKKITINDHLQVTGKGREQYILEHPQDAEDIRSLVAARL